MNECSSLKMKSVNDLFSKVLKKKNERKEEKKRKRGKERKRELGDISIREEKGNELVGNWVLVENWE